MKVVVTVIIAITALSTTLAEDSSRTEKHSFGSEHGTQFSLHNNLAQQQQQQQFDYHNSQPNQVHQYNQEKWFQPNERLNKAEEYYQHIQQQQFEWESPKQNTPVHHGFEHYQHDKPLQQNQGVRYHYGQQQGHDYQQHQGLVYQQQQVHGYQQHQAQYQPYYHQEQQEQLSNHHHRQHPQPSWNQQKQTENVPYPVQHQKYVAEPANVPYPVAFEKNFPQASEKKESPVQNSVNSFVQRPAHKHIQVIPKRGPKPVAVHVDKPYPVYMEHPVYMEKPVPLQVIIMKEKNNSLWG